MGSTLDPKNSPGACGTTDEELERQVRRKADSGKHSKS